MKSLIDHQLQEHLQTVTAVAATLVPQIQAAGRLMIDALAHGRKIMLFGNGGSAADAQHLAAELTGRFRRPRQGLPAIALTTDTSALTAIGNDFGFEQIFARQVEALAGPGDLAIGISTSGRSPNVLEGLRRARLAKCRTLGLAGGDGGRLRGLCDVCLIVPSRDPARIQEAHILLGHTLCHIAETALCGRTTEPRQQNEARPVTKAA